MQSKKRVVIVGGGFGGLRAAQELASEGRCHVTLVDKRNHHLFQPLLYQVATASLNASDISYPLREVFRDKKRVEVVLDEVTDVDLEGNRVHLRSGSLTYDYLVLACGATTTYFGRDEWRAHATSLKTLNDALAIRQKLLTTFELAARTQDSAERARLLTFVVIGGGPTGVETAGGIAEMIHGTLRHEFPEVDLQASRVLLVEAGPRILATYREGLSGRARLDLASLGVEVLEGRKVTEIGSDFICFGDERIACGNVIWAAGVGANRLNAKLGVPLDRAGRVVVTPTLQIPGHPRVFVIGDQAGGENALPALAAVATQQGSYVARSLRRELAGLGSLAAFRYRHRGQMAIIAKYRAVVELPIFRATGFVAWLSWMIVHACVLGRLRNRLAVLFQWALTSSFRRTIKIILE